MATRANTTREAADADDLVHTVYSYRFLTAIQLERLFAGRPGVSARGLSRLVAAGYLAALKRPVLANDIPDTVYALAQRGADLVAARLGIDRRLVRWRKYHNLVGLPYLEHHLAVNDVRIAFVLGTKKLGGSLEHWRSEVPLKEDIEDPVEHAPPLTLRPDAYIRCLACARRFHFFLELDLATESHTRFAAKVRRYLAYKESNLFRLRVGGRSFRVLIVVPTFTRLRALKRVVEAQGGERMFWLAVYGDLMPDRIGEEVWHLAGEDMKAQLFDSPAGGPVRGPE